RMAQRFHEAHDARYGHSNPGAPVELVAARTAAIGELGHAEPERLAAGEPPAPRRRRAVFGRTAHELVVVHRDELGAGVELAGPAIVEEQTATTIVPPAWRLRVEESGTLLLTRKNER